MNVLRLFPVIFSFLILSAHFSRAGSPLLTIIFLLLPLLLFIKKAWVARLLQIFLVIGSIEWIRILFVYTNERQAVGEPYIRLIIILGIVALFTGLSALVFRNKVLKERYKL
ncbi:MAG: hypothetical protein MUP82_05195 [Candidatus Marinimicrobia bacterium]|nr:hypothetical protein [Candidatus Neomarinimicrobiota bacterium]